MQFDRKSNTTRIPLALWDLQKNASVIKLSPKKATVAASPAERKMMAELQKMQDMMNAMKKENERLKAGGGGGGGGGDVEALQKMLESKQAELQAALNSEEVRGRCC